MSASLRFHRRAASIFAILALIASFWVIQTATGNTGDSIKSVVIDDPGRLPPDWEVKPGRAPVLLRVAKRFSGSTNSSVDLTVEQTPPELMHESLNDFVEALKLRLKPSGRILFQGGEDITALFSEEIYATSQIEIGGLKTYVVGTKGGLNCDKWNYFNIELEKGLWAWVRVTINNTLVGEEDSYCNPARGDQWAAEALQVVHNLSFEISRTPGTQDGASPTRIIRTGPGSNAPSWTPLPGLSGIGAIPGPHSAVEAIVGMLVPGLIAVFGGMLGGLFGNAPLPSRWRARSGSDDAGPAPESPRPDTIEWTSPAGRTYVLEKQADGTYRNSLTGGVLDSDRIEEWEQATAAIERDQRAFGDREMDKMSRGDTAFDRDLQALKEKAAERDKLFSNLATMEKGILFGHGGAADFYKPPGAPGNLMDQIKALREQLTQGRDIDRSQYDRVWQIYRDAQSGKILAERQLPTSNQIMRDTVSDAVNATVDEVLTGQTADGATSWKAMIARGLMDFATGGTSEVVLTSASALKTMKNYVDRGGDSVLGGFREAVGEVLVNELSDRVFDKAIRFAGHNVENILTDLGDSLSTAGKIAPPTSPAAGRVKSVGKATDVRPSGASAAGPDARAPAAAKTDAAERIKQGMTKGADGTPRAKKADVLEIMRNPQKVRDLKNAPPEIQQAFENTRQHIYEGHDMNLENYVRTKVPGMAHKEVRVMDFRTPGKDGKLSINTDRDYRVCYKDVDPKTGKEMWIEVDRRYWENESYRSFAEETGGPTYPPDAAKHWAEQHQQLGTDKYHAEASPDFSDQAMMFIEDPKNPPFGHWEKVQIESNISLVRRGQSTLIDPDGMGSMYATKVGDAMKRGSATTEAFVQAGKAVTELEAVRRGYARQGYEIGTIKPALRTGMDIVANAARKGSDPSVGGTADAQLRAAGFEGGLQEFMAKISNQFAALKWANEG